MVFGPLAHAGEEKLQNIKFYGDPENLLITVTDKNDQSYTKSCNTPCKMELDFSRSLEFLGEHPRYKNSDQSKSFATNSLNLATSLFRNSGFEQSTPAIKITLLPRSQVKEDEASTIKSDPLVSGCAAPSAIVSAPPRPEKIAYPVMPRRVKKNGFCKIRFNIDPSGAPVDVEATECTDSKFRKNSIRTVKKTKYPANSENKFICNVGVKISYRYTE